jgi:hypothetical protein
MKKPVVNPSERDCPECMGSGFTVVEHPTKPGVKIYKACEECLGKGRVAAQLRRPYFALLALMWILKRGFRVWSVDAPSRLVSWGR